MAYRFLSIWLTVSLLSAFAFGMTPDEALKLSAETGRPILAMATSDTCVPCQQLKHNVYNSVEIQDQISKCIVLEIDAKTPQFEQFSNQFPAAISGVPVVYFIRPDRAMTYGQTGMLTVPELQLQLNEILTQVGKPLTKQQSKAARRVLDQAKGLLKTNESAAALRLTDDLIQANSLAAPIQEAHTVRQSAIAALDRRIDLIATRINTPKSTHGAAFRLAEVYAEAKFVPELRTKAEKLLLELQLNAKLKPAIEQGMELVKARVLERRSDFSGAINAYERILSIDSDSPSSGHARKKITILRNRVQSVATFGGSAGAFDTIPKPAEETTIPGNQVKYE